MAITARALLLCCLMATLPLTGCITTQAPTPQVLTEENEQSSAEVCSLPSESLTQTSTGQSRLMVLRDNLDYLFHHLTPEQN